MTSTLSPASDAGFLHPSTFQLDLPADAPAQELLSKSIGKPNIGGPLALTTQDSQLFTEADLLGRWSLIYFGFTNCPDICPEELDKMGEAVEDIDRERKERVTPIFISVDPARDGVKEVKRYIRGG